MINELFITHRFNDGKIISTNDCTILSKCAEFTYFHSLDAEDVESASAAITYYNSNGTERPCKGLYEFLAAVLHLMQQTPGKLLYRSSELKATQIEQTRGAGYYVITDSDLLEYCGVKMTLLEILQL